MLSSGDDIGKGADFNNLDEAILQNSQCSGAMQAAN